MWKLRKYTLTEKIFRQITYLVISLLSRNFCQKEGELISVIPTLCIFDIEILFSAAQVLREINFIVFGTSKYAICLFLALFKYLNQEYLIEILSLQNGKKDTFFRHCKLC